MLLLKHSIK